MRTHSLSPTAITRLTAAWQADYEAFQKRDLSDRDYVYVWADGVHFRIRLEEDRLCALVMIGVRPDGTKELLAIEDGYRESTESEEPSTRRISSSFSEALTLTPRPRANRSPSRFF